MCLTLLVHRENRLAKRNSMTEQTVRSNILWEHSHKEGKKKARGPQPRNPFLVWFYHFVNRKTALNCLQPTIKSTHWFSSRQICDFNSVVFGSFWKLYGYSYVWQSDIFGVTAHFFVFSLFFKLFFTFFLSLSSAWDPAVDEKKYLQCISEVPFLFFLSRANSSILFYRYYAAMQIFCSSWKKDIRCASLAKVFEAVVPQLSQLKLSCMHVHPQPPPTHKRTLPWCETLTHQSLPFTHPLTSAHVGTWSPPLSSFSVSHHPGASDITLTLPHCPTYKGRERGRELERKETEVERGEAEADGRRRFYK